MPARWIVNASPLIVLCKAGHQHLLLQLSDELVLPEGVVSEIEAGPDADPARMFLRVTPLPIVSVDPDPTVLAWDLGRGESEVISFALQNPGWRVVIDDGMARRCARTLSIPVLGTLGIILRARQMGVIPSAADMVRSLVAHGYRIDENVVREALSAAVGEKYD